jgi:hypothetical protein
MNKQGETTSYWRLDETENALDYLETAIQALMEVERNPWAWKRVFINLHGALYGFGVCAATGTNYERVVNKNKKTGREYLKNFNDIMKMCQQDKWMKQYVHSKTLKLTKDQKEAIDFVKDGLRNPLAHFIPKLWYVETEGLPDKAAHAFDVIEFLAVESGNVLFHQRSNGQKRVLALCETGRQLAASIRPPKLKLDID